MTNMKTYTGVQGSKLGVQNYHETLEAPKLDAQMSTLEH